MSATSPDDVRLEDLTGADFPAAARLAEEIWLGHYASIVGRAQVEYMLAGRFVPERLRLYVGANDRWFKLLVVAGEAVGYCSYALLPGDEMKLEQLYLRASMKGRGLGGLMLRHVEGEARAHGRRTLVLTVNKKNVDSIAIYRKGGFTVREEAVFDIGHGYVMDDYVMEKKLGAGDPAPGTSR